MATRKTAKAAKTARAEKGAVKVRELKDRKPYMDGLEVSIEIWSERVKAARAAYLADPSSAAKWKEWTIALRVWNAAELLMDAEVLMVVDPPTNAEHFAAAKRWDLRATRTEDSEWLDRHTTVRTVKV